MLKNSLLAAILLLFSFYVFKKEVLETASPTSVTLIESELAWNGDSLPPYPSSKPQISILKITIPAHAELPLHYHPVINAGVLLKGELYVIDEDGNELTLKAGDPIIEVVNKKHLGKNMGDEDAEIIVFYAGTPGMKITEKVQ
ncbi:quercetin dioxygenase-like cupin family protein [Algoriphagus sp. 4150]|uniref:cupin domain-containing protein n=1 Tax=Algoriphagus sp. 4150 TaxID=2817756 RepID=UPI002861538C|nr:cupin domain-containing protein [Algoriphagus sp. 4150]MDR7132140.1 quercetin dioxygenase-like cupin family protein [Algoriphagus sp. 4150]